jgi:hypothetical protein
MSEEKLLDTTDSLRLLFGTYDEKSTDYQKAHEPPYVLMNTLLHNSRNGECSSEATKKAKLILKVKYWNETDKLKGLKVPNDKTTSDVCGGYVKAEPDDVHPCVTDFVISLAAWLREIDCPTGTSVTNMANYTRFLADLESKDDRQLETLLRNAIVDTEHRARSEATAVDDARIGSVIATTLGPIISPITTKADVDAATRVAEAEAKVTAVEARARVAVAEAEARARVAVAEAEARARDAVAEAKARARAAKDGPEAGPPPRRPPRVLSGPSRTDEDWEDAGKRNPPSTSSGTTPRFGDPPAAVEAGMSGGHRGGATSINTILNDRDSQRHIAQQCYSHRPGQQGKCIRDALKTLFRAGATATYTTLATSSDALSLAKNLHRVSSEFEELKDMFMVLKRDSSESVGLTYGTTEWGRATPDEITKISDANTNKAQYRVNVVKDSGVPVIAKCLKGIVDENVNVFFTDAKGKVRVVCGCSSDMLYNLFMAVYNGQYSGFKPCGEQYATYYNRSQKSVKDVIVLCNQDDYKDDVKRSIGSATEGNSVNYLTHHVGAPLVLFHNVETNPEKRRSQQLGTLNCSDLFNYKAYFTDVMPNEKNKEVKKQFDREDCKNLFADDSRPLQFDSKKNDYYFMSSTGVPQYIGKDNCFGFKIDQKHCDRFIDCFLTGDNDRMSACLKSLLDQDAFATGFYDLSHVMSPMAHQFFNKLAIQLEAMPNAHGYVQPVIYEQWLQSTPDSKNAYVSEIKNSLSYDTKFKPLVNYIKGAISSCRANPSILNARQQSPAPRPHQYVLHPMYRNGNNSTFETPAIFASAMDRWSNFGGTGNGQRGGASSCDNCAASLYNEVRGAIEGLKAKGVVFEDDDRRAIEAGYRQTLKFMEQAEKLKNVMISAINLANQHGIQCKETKTLSRSVGKGKPLSAFKHELESTIHDCKEYGARAGDLAQSFHAHVLATLRNREMTGQFRN